MQPSTDDHVFYDPLTVSGSEDDDLRRFCRIADISFRVFDPKPERGGIRPVTAGLQFKWIGE
jgi:hypothetical protein